MSELLLGAEAVALASIDAGIRGAFSYPGTPATEILETIQLRGAGVDSLAARWSPNEKVAYEEALGMSFSGYRSVISMKHVGLNVAADPFMSSALTGVVGGLVVIVADDPGMHSSQNEQDTRFYAEFAQLPLFEPSNQQEAYDMTREAFRYSEKVSTPVMIRLVTRLSHSRSLVNRIAADQLATEHRRGEPKNWTLLPVNARRRFRRLLDMQDELVQHSDQSPFNRLSLRGKKGILSSGLAFNYVAEALGDDKPYSRMHVGHYPIPQSMIRNFVDHCEEVLVVEEGYPFIESRLLGLMGVPGKSIRGKKRGPLPLDGELNPDLVRAALDLPPLEALETIADLPPRPPSLCAGCPHCDTFHDLVEAAGPELNPVFFSDIGCYTLGAMPPYNAVHTCVDMGASISMALGAAKAGVHPVLCTIGDSTFTHSGMQPLMSAAHEDANMTVFILDNAAVAMTGGQEIFATGEALQKLVLGLGVRREHLVLLDPVPKSHSRNTELIRREIQHRGLSVIIASRPCIHVKRHGAKPAVSLEALGKSVPKNKAGQLATLQE